MLLKNSKGDLCSCWDAINNQTILQHTKIKVSFEHSIFLKPQKYNENFYKNLLVFVFTNSLDLIAKEKARVRRVGVDSVACGYILRTTHGLP